MRELAIFYTTPQDFTLFNARSFNFDSAMTRFQGNQSAIASCRRCFRLTLLGIIIIALGVLWDLGRGAMSRVRDHVDIGDEEDNLLTFTDDFADMSQKADTETLPAPTVAQRTATTL